jgi:hypothetical protein
MDLTLAALGLAPGLAVRYLPHFAVLYVYWLFLATDDCNMHLKSGVDHPHQESGGKDLGKPSYTAFRSGWRSSWHNTCLRNAWPPW